MTGNEPNSEKSIESCLQIYFGCQGQDDAWRDYSRRAENDKCKRYASFDYCYNYFYSFRNNPEKLITPENMQMSCFQLGFYLASWGMLRNSFLQRMSIKGYEEIIEIIANKPHLWAIDLDNYEKEGNLNALIEFKDEITKALKRVKLPKSSKKDRKEKSINPSDTLTSKIMLGVFGNVPAYDNYFINWIKQAPDKNIARNFSRESLLAIKKYYVENLEKSMNRIEKIETLDYSAKSSKIYYTKAKLLDIYGYCNGGGKD